MTPGLNVLKTFDPPLHAIDGGTFTGVKRRGKILFVEIATADGEPLTLLTHLMSAGRLQMFDKRASMRDRTSRVLLRLSGDRELRLREFGTRQAAWVKLLRPDALEAEDVLRTLGPEAWPAPPEDLGALLASPRPLHSLLRDQQVIAGIGRTWVDEILHAARLSPFKRGDDLSEEEAGALRDGDRLRAGSRDRPPTRRRCSSRCRRSSPSRRACTPTRASRARAAGPCWRPCSTRTT